jgi:hypothetical protein
MQEEDTMYLISEAQREAIIRALATASHPNAPFSAINSLIQLLYEAPKHVIDNS